MTYLRSFNALDTQQAFYSGWSELGALCDLAEVFNLQFPGCSLPGPWSLTLFICSLFQIQGNPVQISGVFLWIAPSSLAPHPTTSSVLCLPYFWSLFPQLSKIIVLGLASLLRIVIQNVPPGQFYGSFICFPSLRDHSLILSVSSFWRSCFVYFILFSNCLQQEGKYSTR